MKVTGTYIQTPERRAKNSRIILLVLLLGFVVACGGEQLPSEPTTPEAPAPAAVDPTAAGNAAAATVLEGTPPESEEFNPIGQADHFGTIHGQIRLNGKSPGNMAIRMRMDPMCSKINEGRLVLQEAIVTDENGGLANVFVQLEGPFYQSSIPTESVIINQQDCVFLPRVVGVRADQPLQIKNSDPLLHNVRSSSETINGFNIGQPMTGMSHTVRLKNEGEMLRLRCDRHRWMTAYVGIVMHPYFTVSDDSGTFTINGVPAGTQTIQAWHEEYGQLTQTVDVQTDSIATVNLVYLGESSQ